jgi:hypothetical protein
MAPGATAAVNNVPVSNIKTIIFAAMQTGRRGIAAALVSQAARRNSVALDIWQHLPTTAARQACRIVQRSTGSNVLKWCAAGCRSCALFAGASATPRWLRRLISMTRHALAA